MRGHLKTAFPASSGCGICEQVFVGLKLTGKHIDEFAEDSIQTPPNRLQDPRTLSQLGGCPPVETQEGKNQGPSLRRTELRLDWEKDQFSPDWFVPSCPAPMWCPIPSPNQCPHAAMCLLPFPQVGPSPLPNWAAKDSSGKRLLSAFRQSDISPQLRPQGTSPSPAECFRAKVRDHPCVSASPGRLSRMAHRRRASPCSPAGLCLEARAGCPNLLPAGQVRRKLAVAGVLCNASRPHVICSSAGFVLSSLLYKVQSRRKRSRDGGGTGFLPKFSAHFTAPQPVLLP